MKYNTFEDEIQHVYLKPSYERDINAFVTDRFKCRVWGYRFEIAGKILTGLATASAFIAGQLPNFKYGSFISGSLGVLAMTCQHLSTYGLNRSRESTEQLNQTLHSIGVKTAVPDVTAEHKDDKN
jgi:hypothetical protein